MCRRKLLARLTGLMVLLGLLFAAVPFVVSMNINKAVKSSASVRIEISKIPEAGALVTDYLWFKALVVKNPDITVFLIPYDYKYYLLPDPTWDRPVIPCSDFVVGTDEFFCNSYLSEEARWDFQGKSKGAWMADLQRANYRVQGGYIILSPEYN